MSKPKTPTPRESDLKKTKIYPLLNLPPVMSFNLMKMLKYQPKKKNSRKMEDPTERSLKTPTLKTDNLVLAVEKK